MHNSGVKFYKKCYFIMNSKGVLYCKIIANDIEPQLKKLRKFWGIGIAKSEYHSFKGIEVKKKKDEKSNK